MSLNQYMKNPSLLFVDFQGYLMMMGMVYGAVFLVGCIVLLFLRPRGLTEYVLRVKKLGIFLLILLPVGDFFGCVWGEIVWGRFYLSTDYCNCDFLPFWPITQGVIDAPFGNDPHGLIGVTLTQLNLIWLVFAIATWGSTLSLYRLIGRISRRNQFLHKASIAVA
jgi:hypothetical protein